MEVDQSQQEVAKKLWDRVRAVFFMLRREMSKSRIMVDLHLMLKRGNKLAGKAIGNLIMPHHDHHSPAFSCRSNDAISFISPREYEFSCSNSPATFYPFHTHNKRKHHHRHHHHHHHHQHYLHHFAKAYKYDDVTTVAAVQKMLEKLNNEVVVEAAAAVSPFPGFGKSPMVRQLRITDSPFPLKDEGDSQVDKAAEEFIKKFYKDLKQQKTASTLALESPYHAIWGR